LAAFYKSPSRRTIVFERGLQFFRRYFSGATNMLESVTEEVGSVLLTLASALLFEELTLGALVRLIVAPKAHSDGRRHKNAAPPN